MIGLGIIAATVLARPRAVERGLHPDTPVEVLVWVVPLGILGARAYHVITDRVPFNQWIKVWEGGLGIPGGVLAGVAGALLFARSRNLSPATLFDAMIPAVPLGQAIGRWGNWWNQELYGRPTDLPWGLEIDEVHRANSGFPDAETFHPTFLYESLWNLALMGFLIWIDRKRVLKPGRLVWVYAAGYALGRLWIEALRIDEATKIAGVRVNLWVMGLVLAVALIALSRGRLGGDGAPAERSTRSASARSRAAGVAAVGAAGTAKAATKPGKSKASGSVRTKTDDDYVDERAQAIKAAFEEEE